MDNGIEASEHGLWKGLPILYSGNGKEDEGGDIHIKETSSPFEFALGLSIL